MFRLPAGYPSRSEHRGLSVNIGIDLDNTLIDYSHVFAHVGIDFGVLPEDMASAPKSAVKSYLQQEPQWEITWMRIQGQVYGRCIERATLMPGAREALLFLRENKALVSIVSHKTIHGHFDADRVNLHEAALSWLRAHDFFSVAGIHMDSGNVHFLETRDEKLRRIAELGCEVFIDDLPEILTDPAFPDGVKRVWFGADHHPDAALDKGLKRWENWDDIHQNFLRPLLLLARRG